MASMFQRAPERLFMLCAWVLGLWAQTPDSPPVIRVDVRQVLVPVVVTDDKGHHVTNLKASDFRIFEDGAPQEIAAFSTDTSPLADTPAASTERTPVPSAEPASTVAQRATASPGGDAGRTFVICVDTLHSASASSARTRQALIHPSSAGLAPQSQHGATSLTSKGS
jgi:VWFA-related protein